MELKKKFVSGFIWTAGEKFGSMFIKLAVSLILIRHLVPDDYDLIGILWVFIAISTVLIDSGFREALIQKQKISHEDYNSTFFLNIAIGLVAYAVLASASGYIATYFERPALASMGPWLFSILPLSAAGMIHVVRLEREMRFNVLSKVYFIRTIVSSAVALAMIYTGWGVWSIVGQQISFYLTQTIALWLMDNWRPTRSFSMASVRGLFRFGSNLLLVGLIGQTAGRLTNVIIGKFYAGGQLGLFDRAQNIKDEIVTSIQQSIVSVSYPTFSAMQTEDDRLKNASRKVIAVLSFVLFPVMAGLMATSAEIFAILLKPEWMPAVPYFKVFCATAFFIPLLNICLHIIKAKGASRTILYLEIIKKAFFLAAIIITAKISVMAMVWAIFAWMAFEMTVNVIATQRFIRYSIGEITRDSLPYFAMTAVMYACVIGITYIIPNMTMGVSLIVKAITGVVVYGGLTLLFRPLAWNEALIIAKGLLNIKSKK